METTAGSVTGTKQFVWATDRKRPYKACEERDGSGVLTKKFFGRGQMNSTTKYFYDKDHLTSVREMTDNSGIVQAQYAFDPYGRVSKISELVASDFGFGGNYLHSRSGLNLTRTRPYISSLGRWINRDLITERGGLNLYSYVLNSPVSKFDPSGLLPPSGISLPNTTDNPIWFRPGPDDPFSNMDIPDSFPLDSPPYMMCPQTRDKDQGPPPELPPDTPPQYDNEGNPNVPPGMDQNTDFNPPV